MILSNTAIKNRTTVWVLMVLIIVAGVAAYVTLPRESAPDVPIPWVLVTTPREGVSPEDMESSVTMKIEPKLTGLKGLKEIVSTSGEGMSMIRMEFQPDIRIEDALQRVKDKVDQAKQDLDPDVEEPIISEVNISEFPIMMVSISGPVSMVQLKGIADKLEDRVEAVQGVLECDVLGALEPEIRLEFDPKRLGEYGISVTELITIMGNENVNVSAGGLETGRTKIIVRTPAEINSADDVNWWPLTTRDGKIIYLLDVADVRNTFKDRESFSRTDGEASITLTVKKRVGANILEIAGTVKAILAEARKQVPAGVKLDLTLDRSKETNMMVSDLQNNILTALILVVGVLVLFMGFRTSLIVGMAIPLSMLASFAALSMMGITLNMIVLFSLILSLGMLVDNAIVIVENIYRFRQLGHGRIDAAMKGAAEVAWPVITSTATTIAAFAPLLLWQGVVGEFMKYLPITVITVLTCSLFVALVISPVLASVFARGKAPVHENAGEHWFKRGYRRVLVLSLKHRAVTILLAVLSLLIVGNLYVKFGSGRRFFPDIDPARGIINVRSPQGTSVQYSDKLARVIEGRIGDTKDQLDHIQANVGGGGGSGFGQGATGPHVANITLIFRDYEDRARPSKDIIKEFRKKVAGIPGAEIKVQEDQEGPPTGAAVTIRIAGEDFKTLTRLSEQAKRMIVGVPGLVNLRSDYEASRPELQFISDRRRAMLYNVNTRLIGQFLKTSVFGSKVSTFRRYNDEYDITARLPISDRTDIESLINLRVPDPRGNPVPLSSLGSFVYRAGKGTINRIDHNRVITLTGDAEGRLPEKVLKDVMKILTPAQAQPKPNPLKALAIRMGWIQPLEPPAGGLEMPTGYDITYAGEKEESDKAMAFLGKAYIMAMLIIAMILVAQFNTISAPFIIMVTVALSLIGVLVGLMVTHTPFVIIMTGIGVVSLAGVVVNNAIVLLDYTRQLQRKGMNPYDAIVTAGMTRLRPVLLTAVTTILGLMPMATGISFNFVKFKLVMRSESTQWWSPMANAVIFGLAFATILTLVVVPTLYHGIYCALRRWGWGGLKSQDEPAPVEVDLARPGEST